MGLVYILYIFFDKKKLNRYIISNWSKGVGTRLSYKYLST